MYGFYKVSLFVCVGFVICGCFDNCVAVLVMCTSIYCVFVFLYIYIYIYLFLFVTSVRTTATE